MACCELTVSILTKLGHKLDQSVSSLQLRSPIARPLWTPASVPSRPRPSSPACCRGWRHRRIEGFGGKLSAELGFAHTAIDKYVDFYTLDQDCFYF